MPADSDPRGEEIEEIKAVIEVEYFDMKSEIMNKECPYILASRIHDPYPEALLEAIDEVFLTSANRQVVYFSAHGTLAGLSFSLCSSVSVSYAELFKRLQPLAEAVRDNKALRAAIPLPVPKSERS